MSQRNTVVRSMHDLGLAAWFGGTLAGAIAVNGAAACVSDPNQRLHVANAGWARWTPVNLAAISAHLVGGAGLLLANKGRVAAQRGVGASTAAKAALTIAALGVTAYSRVLGRKLEQADGAPVEGGTDPAPDTPADVAKAQQQLKVAQWLVPGPEPLARVAGCVSSRWGCEGRGRRPRPRSAPCEPSRRPAAAR